MTDVRGAQQPRHLPPPEALDRFYGELGQRVRAARTAAGLTQEDLGVRCGMSRASIANLEAGRQKVPVHVLAQAAALLGVEFASLLPQLADRLPGEARYQLRGAPQEHVRLVEQLLLATADKKGPAHA